MDEQPEEPWPPDWRTADADALEAKVIRVGVIRAELDELEQLLPADQDVGRLVRELQARVRIHVSEMRSACDALRAAVSELTR